MTHATQGRRLARASVLALLVASATCGEYAATNPYDARVSESLSLAGPDTTHSRNQVLTFTLSAVPAWPDARPVWRSSNPALRSLGDGRFEVDSATHEDAFATVTASLGTKSVSHTVRVRQRTARIIMSGAVWYHLPLVDSAYATAAGMSMPTTVWLVDSVGYDIPDLLPDGRRIARFVVRDTTVAALTPDGGLYSVGPGRTYLVVSADGRRDSMVVRVE